ncbi:ABC transporter permease [Botrimarina hoheduenensis]|uniref:Macrolide export ATP-binding/permease protein MacB n=1 Tax=Botrimarina hoheduenensis TaxID=2528000 RepID=A0A5C5W9X1_9BACT|nr:ABC transporter permease [Botrimarina hoheduenensis]TWT47450.1 Macrolide export ATP-binding/permease protein MacB [Botrimarina hoheduenensis]
MALSFWRIAWNNLKQRGLASALTALSMALGVAAMCCVIVVYAVAVRQFSQDAQGYHLIVGGKGGALQLVLSTVYHLGQPLYPIPYSEYRRLVDGDLSGVVEVAVPYCLGDSFDPTTDPENPSDRRYRVVATTPDLFDKIEYGTDERGVPIRYTFRAGGRNFRTDHAYEAVLGSVVAAQSGLKVGDTFSPTHGISGEGEKHEEFTIVGVLETTGTANDRAVFINLEGFYLLEKHALSDAMAAEREARIAATEALEKNRATPAATPRGLLPPEVLYDQNDQPIEPLAEAKREVTSVLVLCSSDLGPLILNTKINKDPNQSSQAVAPAGVVTSLLEKIVGPIQLVLLVLTILIVLVAAIGILVSIYNSMSERKHDIAVMRALGASRVSVMLIILTEAVLISLIGALGGLVLGHLFIAAAAPYLEAEAGVRLAFWRLDPLELMIVPALVALAGLVGLLPAFSAYRTDVARSLSGGQ